MPLCLPLNLPLVILSSPKSCAPLQHTLFATSTLPRSSHHQKWVRHFNILCLPPQLLPRSCHHPNWVRRFDTLHLPPQLLPRSCHHQNWVRHFNTLHLPPQLYHDLVITQIGCATSTHFICLFNLTAIWTTPKLKCDICQQPPLGCSPSAIRQLGLVLFTALSPCRYTRNFTKIHG